MEVLENALAKLSRDSTLSQSVSDVDNILSQLVAAREAISADPNSASITLAKMQNPVKQGFDRMNEGLKKVHAGQVAYGKVLNSTLPQKNLPTEYDALAAHPSLTNRAIAMHLLREGQFDVASIFLDEVQNHPAQGPLDLGAPAPSDIATADLEALRSQDLQAKFSNMYAILNELRQRNLLPAIEWARTNSAELEKRGSNLEFELSKLQFIWLFKGYSNDPSSNGLLGALNYAREHFGRFQQRHLRDIQQLSAAMAFRPNLATSPYSHTFDTDTAWDEVSASFTREFCSLLGLSAESPLYIACTVGAIALPVLLKLAGIMKEKRTEWTTQHELPVEIPLPKSMHFHAIFVCPVSKEQATVTNPPMMMPCGHVVAKESLQRLSKGQRFKCPYCPNESWPKDAKEIYM